MSVNGKFRDIARADLMEVADRFGVRRPQDTLADVRAALDNWPGFAKGAGIPSPLGDRVVQDLLPV
jgi:serine/threonine-protein kinase HipA